MKKKHILIRWRNNVYFLKKQKRNSFSLKENLNHLFSTNMEEDRLIVVSYSEYERGKML